MRPSRVEIDLEAIAHNVRALTGLVAPAALCTVVKADAYGHGDVPVAETALAHGASWLAVALLEEGARLREAGIEAPILLLSEPGPNDAGEVIRWGLTPTVYRHSFLEALAAVAPDGTSVHLKLDTGMHRVGADADTVVMLARRLAAEGLPLRLAGLWTHFAVAEEDPAFTEKQIERYQQVERRLADHGIDPGLRHLANSPGALLYPKAQGGMVRVGLCTYGLYPSEECAAVVGLRPAMRVVSRVSYLRRLPAGARPSYGRRRPLAREATVATVPIGYADGVPRPLGDRGGEVLIRGKRYPLAGAVTMDQIMVDVGDDQVEVGDEVVLIGRQGDAEIPADEWAEKMGTISYEVVSRIGPRLPRTYLE